jgi:hypothetical protein
MLAYFPIKEITRLREKARLRAFLVKERVKVEVEVKSVLTYEGLKWSSDYGMFTKKGRDATLIHMGVLIRDNKSSHKWAK